MIELKWLLQIKLAGVYERVYSTAIGEQDESYRTAQLLHSQHKHCATCNLKKKKEITHPESVFYLL